ncbi:hypothetical protein D3C79_788980 [compost metagenome]
MKSTPYCEIFTLIGLEYCWRMALVDKVVAQYSYFESFSTTSTEPLKSGFMDRK